MSAPVAAPLAAAGTRVRLAALPPLALYVHMPWCVRKCPYCDFNSHEWRGGGAIPEAEYIAALVADLESALPAIWGRRVTTVFFGGGTPSLFSAEAIDRLLAAIRARVPLEPGAEITLEANPGTFEAQKFRGYRAAGVNRLSIGVQSFDPVQLARLGRIHDAGEARRAIETARALFDTFNVDLMYALPGQTPEAARADVEVAIAAGAPHVSAYHLTIEPNTYFHAHPPAVPDDDLAAAIQEAVVARLADAGYEHYEISAHARPGHAARHNLNYWHFGDYLGIGAGAHSKISFADRIVRETRPRLPRDYMKRALAGDAVQSREPVAVRDLPGEFMMNALRLAAGVPLALFTERTGLTIAAIGPALARAEAAGLLERDHVRLRPTGRGRRYLNDLIGMFLAD